MRKEIIKLSTQGIIYTAICITVFLINSIVLKPMFINSATIAELERMAGNATWEEVEMAKHIMPLINGVTGFVIFIFIGLTILNILKIVKLLEEDEIKK